MAELGQPRREIAHEAPHRARHVEPLAPSLHAASIARGVGPDKAKRRASARLNAPAGACTMEMMSAPFALVALALLAALSLELVRRLRALAGEVAKLTERVHELGTRLEATEQDAAAALTQADVAECVLLDKGIFDEEDLEEARARTGGPEPAARPPDGELN